MAFTTVGKEFKLHIHTRLLLVYSKTVNIINNLCMYYVYFMILTLTLRVVYLTLILNKRNIHIESQKLN